MICKVFPTDSARFGLPEPSSTSQLSAPLLNHVALYVCFDRSFGALDAAVTGSTGAVMQGGLHAHGRTQEDTEATRTEKSGTTPCLESGTFAGACQHKAGKGVAAAGDRSLNCQHSSVSVIWPSVHTGYRRRAEAAEAAFARTQLSGIPVTNSAV